MQKTKTLFLKAHATHRQRKKNIKKKLATTKYARLEITLRPPQTPQNRNKTKFPNLLKS